MQWPSRGEMLAQLRLMEQDLVELTSSLNAFRTWLASCEMNDSTMEHLASFLHFSSTGCQEVSEHASAIEQRVLKSGSQEGPSQDCSRYWTTD